MVAMEHSQQIKRFALLPSLVAELPQAPPPEPILDDHQLFCCGIDSGWRLGSGPLVANLRLSPPFRVFSDTSPKRDGMSTRLRARHIKPRLVLLARRSRSDGVSVSECVWCGGGSATIETLRDPQRLIAIDMPDAS